MAAFWLTAAAALGVIKIEFPVSKMYEVSSQVCIGAVAEVNAELRLATVKVTAVAKGTFPHERIRVQFVRPEGVSAKLPVGSPVVLFLREAEGKSVAIVHAADTWLLANAVAGAAPPAWRTGQIYEGARSFPGRTAALVRLVEGLRDGKALLDDVLDPDGFAGRAKEVATLGAPPRFLLSADVDADGRPELVAGTAAGMRVFAGKPEGHEDITARSGLAQVEAVAGLAGDVDGDGKTDLLLDRTLWLGTSGALRRGDSLGGLPDASWVAGTVHDVTGDGKADIAVVTREGCLVTLANPGSAGRPWPESRTNLWSGSQTVLAAAFSTQWSDDSGLCILVTRGDGLFRYAIGTGGVHAADFVRLTGTQPALGGACFAGVAWDADGNRKMDYLSVAESGGVVLLNRGLGSFVANSDLPRRAATFTLGSESRRLSAGCQFAAGPPKPARKWRQSLLVAFPDGRIFELE
jgi:hypothetical protein